MTKDAFNIPIPDPGKEVMAPNWVVALVEGEQKAIKREDKAKTEARTNAVTGLPNRRAWDEELFHRRNSRHPLTILMIDLNGFKAVNDTYGHAKGDEIIRDAAEIITLSVRPDDYPANQGGDEFGVILDVSNSDPAETVEAVVHRMKEKFAEYNENHNIKLNFSVGSATSPYIEGEAHDVYKTLHDADMAMYEMKRTLGADH